MNLDYDHDHVEYLKKAKYEWIRGCKSYKRAYTPSVKLPFLSALGKD